MKKQRRAGLTIHPRMRFFSLLIVVAGICAPVHAQQKGVPAVLTYPGNVYPASILVVESKPSVVSGGELWLTVRRDSARALEILGPNLLARVFSLPKFGDRPDYFDTTDGCYFYASVLNKVVSNTASDALFVMRTDEKWLTAEKGQALQAARFLVVFEQGTPISETFRFSRTAIEEYFKAGVVVEVTPAKSPNLNQTAIDNMAASQNEATRDYAKKLPALARSLPCYNINKKKIVGESDILIAEAVDCSPDKASEPNS